MVAYELREQGADLTIMAPASHAGRDVLQGEGWSVIIYGRHWIGSNAQATNDGAAIILLGEAWEASPPDLVLLCGDRHETLSAAFAAAALGIPIAHLAGGDVSGGSSDERYRHAITKLADVHFPTHDAAATRIRAMGENPAMIFQFGSASIDRLQHTQTMTVTETTRELGLADARPFILANWQPETPFDHGLVEMLQALLQQPAPVVWVGANPDRGGDEATALVRSVLKHKPQAQSWVQHQNLSPVLYLSALRHAACLIGNSSSGFYEAPYYGTPVINVGNRQQGRGPIPRCLVTVRADADRLADLLNRASVWSKGQPQFLFGDGHAAPAIARTILQMDGQLTGRKLFHDGR